VSVCDSFSTQAPQGSQGKTEAKIQDIKYPVAEAGLVFPYPYYPTGLITSCNNYNPPVQGCRTRSVRDSETPKRPKAQPQRTPTPTPSSECEAGGEGVIIKKFNSYLAGLFEGEGHIWLPNINWKKQKKNKRHNPRFCITFALKNEPLAKKILEIIEYGHIRYKPKENACVLIVSPVKGLKKII
jgi:LAGLIDADG endonuclease